MSEKENIINPSDEVRIVNAFKYWYETNTEKGVTSIPDYICKGLLDLYNKEKEKNKDIEATLKQTQDSWYEDTKKIELNNECEIALNNRIIDLENELNKEKEKNKKAIEMLQEHIKHCEQEAKGSLNNEICHIALEFDKHILQELLQEGDK